MRFHCNGICHKLEGYEKGYHNYYVEGKKWCGSCDYKIIIEDRLCPCCHMTYRKTSKMHRSNKIKYKEIIPVVSIYRKQT